MVNLDNEKQNKQSAIGRRKNVTPDHKPGCVSLTAAAFWTMDTYFYKTFHVVFA